LENLQKVRRDYLNKDVRLALTTLKNLHSQMFPEKNISKINTEKNFAEIYSEIFPFSLTENQNSQSFLKTLERPLVLMGVVENKTSDIGGTPIITKINGQKAILCAEKDHISKEDLNKSQNNSAKKFFNPVFLTLEIPEKNFLEANHPFWIIAEKKWKEQTVLYHESLLYEILGNSVYCNLIFMEIPRSLFAPHKTLEDLEQTLPIVSN
jgi:hypothetical protein